VNEKLRKLLEVETKSSVSKVVSASEQSYGFVSCGFHFIDCCVSPNGLFPKGAVSEIMGLKSTCKTTLVLHVLSHAIAIAKHNNKPMPVIVWADFENQLLDMKQYAAALGVDIAAENFIHIRPSTLEDGTNFILNSVRTGGVDFVVVDSNAAMRPSVEAKNLVGGTHQKGLRSLLISEFMRNLTGDMSEVSNSGRVPPTVIIINQVYIKLNIGGPPRAGPPQYDSPGSGAIKFYASCRLELKAAGFEYRTVKDLFTFESEKVKSASYIKLFVEKSKVSIPHKRTQFVVRYGEGVDPVFTFLKAAAKVGLITMKGSSRFVYEGSSKSYAGFFGLYTFFRENPDELLVLASNEKVKHWKPILEARIPWFQFAQQVMKDTIIKLQQGERTVEFVNDQGEI